MIRTVTKDHIDIARSIYRESAMEADSRLYTYDQRLAWSQYADSEEFYNFVLGDLVLGWFEGEELIGFCSFRSDGYIKGLYVSPQWQGRGLGKSMVSACLKSLYSKQFRVIASSISRPLFEKFGFQLIETEQSKRGGIEFSRYIMELRDN